MEVLQMRPWNDRGCERLDKNFYLSDGCLENEVFCAHANLVSKTIFD